MSTRLKRTFDVVVSGTALVLLAPALACLVVLIRLDSRGPAFYHQRRVGLHGRIFTIWKFRSMYSGSSQSPHHLASTDWFERRPNGQRYKSAADPRVTRIGRILRRTSLDELPQLWNVLAGDMSLVGPRPVMEYERDRFEPWHFEREAVRPGITGLWQVSGRDRLSAPEMLALDVQYVRRWSMWFDLEILARTMPAVLGELTQTPATRLAAAASAAADAVSRSTTPR
jgi:lipopolysaccharide/colanic/teichoic acid biosynthesis glycosyltransferase